MMLPAEARWFAARIRELGDEQVFPLLNVGSQTAAFRSREQPWIDRHIFRPAVSRQRTIVHTDLQAAEGVDLVGDLTDPAFLQELSRRKFRSVICSNLLEHVTAPDQIARGVLEAVEPGGYLLLSVPNTFPYHPDPIDTMYRPSPEELASLFPGTTIVRADRLRCGNLTTYMIRRAIGDPGMLTRTFIRRRKQVTTTTTEGLSAWQWLPWLVRPFYAACVLLRKEVHS